MGAKAAHGPVDRVGGRPAPLGARAGEEEEEGEVERDSEFPRTPVSFLCGKIKDKN